MDSFEPPRYLASLIAAVNDGAKSAQTGVLGFTLVGLYLLATAFSTTDEDLLLQHTMSVSQIGVQVPVIFSLAIAPVVFLFLHTYTLIRYDMLAINLRQFQTEASLLRKEDEERCRQLLANVEFIQARTAPRDSPLYSRVYRFIAWLLLAGFPVATLIAVQVSSLRYQSNAVLRTQQVVDDGSLDERNRTPGVLRLETRLNGFGGPQKNQSLQRYSRTCSGDSDTANTVTRYCAISFGRDQDM